MDQVAGVKSDAKEIGGDKTELRGADSNDTNDRAVNGGNDPALPELFANEHSRQDRQNAGDIIESDHVKHIQHIGHVRATGSLPQERCNCEANSRQASERGAVLLVPVSRCGSAIWPGTGYL